MRFLNKVVVISGSSRNIGLSTARRFAAEGAKVVLNAASSADELSDAAASLQADGAEVYAVLADLSLQEGASALISKTIERFGALDVLVIIHSTRPFSPFLQISAEDWKSVIDTNMTSAFYLCQSAIPHLLASDYPSIIAVGGYSGAIGGAKKAHVSAASRGRTAMLESIALEYASEGLRVNFIAIGAVDTIRKHPEWYPDDQSTNFLRAIPMGRLGKPEEIASVVLFLASRDASFVTNATVRISGGAPT